MGANGVAVSWLRSSIYALLFAAASASQLPPRGGGTPSVRRLQEGYPALNSFTCPPQGVLADGLLPLLRQPQHDAVEQCATRCEASPGCVSFDAGTSDGSARCYRTGQPGSGDGVSGAGGTYQYFSLPPVDAGCAPLARGCARQSNALALGAVEAQRPGCTSASAFGYDSAANIDDGSCEPIVAGCMDPRAINVDPTRQHAANTRNDTACAFPSLDAFTCPASDSYLVSHNILRTDVPGEMNHYTGLTAEACAALCSSTAACLSFDFTENVAMGGPTMCYLGDATAASGTLGVAAGYLYYEKAPAAADRCALGCTNNISTNYAPSATQDDGSCAPVVDGCTDEYAENFVVNATRDDGGCSYGCTRGYHCLVRTHAIPTAYKNLLFREVSERLLAFPAVVRRRGG